jgi:hypothetical protein
MADLISRRRVLSVLVAGGAVSVAAGRAVTAATVSGGATSTPPKVDPTDSLSKALGYVSDSKRVDTAANPQYVAGATCSSCSWYQGKPGDAAGGPCTFFPGKYVETNGWCRMWAKKE